MAIRWLLYGVEGERDKEANGPRESFPSEASRARIYFGDETSKISLRRFEFHMRISRRLICFQKIAHAVS
jgi:hypothetical protein